MGYRCGPRPQYLFARRHRLARWRPALDPDVKTMRPTARCRSQWARHAIAASKSTHAGPRGCGSILSPAPARSRQWTVQRRGIRLSLGGLYATETAAASSADARSPDELAGILPGRFYGCPYPQGADILDPNLEQTGTNMGATNTALEHSPPCAPVPCTPCPAPHRLHLQHATTTAVSRGDHDGTARVDEP